MGIRCDKKRLGLWVIFLMIGTGLMMSLSAQELPNPKKKYFKLDPRVKANDYQPGLLYVKVKPGHHPGAGKLVLKDQMARDVFDRLNVRETRSFITEQQMSSLRARRAKPLKYDMTAYRKIYYDPNSLSLEEAINQLYRTGMFEIVEPAFVHRIEYEPNDSLLSRQYYLELIKAFVAWDITLGSEEVLVAIVDSGIDRNHPDIVDNLWYNEDDPIDGIDNDDNGYVDDYRGWDFAGADQNNPDDEDNDPKIVRGGSHSHGTGVGGVVGATPDNEIGFAGVGFKTRLVFTKHMADNQSEDQLSLFDTYSGILYTAFLGADIINCSFGSSFRSQIAQDVINFVVEDLDAVVVAAAGNSGLEDDDHYPSAYENVLSVSAIDGQLRKSSFTQYGKTVDITAPGSGIPVLEYDDDYGSTQGTSFSCPIVAGGIALVKAHRPELTAQQLMEVVRVTANDTVYDVNSSEIFRNKLGKGLLDIEEALTAQPPSIRLQSYKLLNEEGKTPELGEEGFLVANFRNFLWPSTGGFKVRLTSKSALLEVLDNESTLGKLEMNQVVSNAADPFRIRILENIPPNTRINLLLEYLDGKFYDYQFISVLLNPTFLNIEENRISSSVAQNGRLGYQDTEQSEGLGFVVEDQNILFEMGLIAATSETRVSNNVRSENAEYDNEFESTMRIQDLSPGLFSAAEITGSFNDSPADTAIGVEIGYRSMVWKEAPDDHYFIIEYEVTNTNENPVDNFHLGLYADWDISEEGRSDRAVWNDSLSIGYVYNTDTSENDLLIGGIQVLTGQKNYFAIDNDQSTEGNPFGVYDGFKDEEKFQSVSSGIGRDSAGFVSETGADVSHAVAAGPYNLDPQETIKIAFAIHGANSVANLLQSAQAADTMYNLTLQAPVPVVEDVVVCYRENATLSASGASSFKWYASKTGGEALSSGADFTTGELTSDTIFYVSNADSTYESVRTPAHVMVEANPEITISGSTFLCDGDTVVLIADEADSYLWTPGNQTTQSIAVTEAGDYTLTVTDTELGCESTSDVLSIVKLESPEAAFQADPEILERNQEVTLSLSDQSVDASEWFWELSNGETSTDQDPEFTVNTSEALTVNLTITASNGCQDTSKVIIDVVTSLEDQLPVASWNLYPNPADSRLYFDLVNDFTGSYQVSIYQFSGRLIARHEYQKTAERSMEEIEMAELPAGLYLVELELPGYGRAVRKIIMR